MSKQQKKSSHFALTLGLLGMIAGVILIFGDNWFIGVAGTIASAGIAYKGYQDSKAAQGEEAIEE